VIAEPDVTLTDYGLAVECAVLAWLAGHRGSPGDPLPARFALFFSAGAGAALAGGTFHGFFPQAAEAAGARIAWTASLLAIGLVAVAAWAIAARILLSPGAAAVAEGAAAVGYLAYAAVVLLGSRDFRVAVVNYLPATVALLVAFGVGWWRHGARPLLYGVGGLLVTFLAAGLQQAGVGLHPVYASHNAVYHVIQGGALLLIYQAARGAAPSC
jgi:hypothetical protein